MWVAQKKSSLENSIPSFSKNFMLVVYYDWDTDFVYQDCLHWLGTHQANGYRIVVQAYQRFPLGSI